jgi:protein-tyrosine phosphatase
MAEALFKKMSGSDSQEKFEAASAGILAAGGFPSTEETVRVLKEEEGLDVSGHRSRRLTQEMIKEFDRIFVMEKFQQDWVLQIDASAKEKVCLLDDTDIPDPIRMSYEFYKNVLAVIRKSVKKILEEKC